MLQTLSSQRLFCSLGTEKVELSAKMALADNARIDPRHDLVKRLETDIAEHQEAVQETGRQVSVLEIKRFLSCAKTRKSYLVKLV